MPASGITIVHVLFSPKKMAYHACSAIFRGDYASTVSCYASRCILNIASDVREWHAKPLQQKHAFCIAAHDLECKKLYMAH